DEALQRAEAKLAEAQAKLDAHERKDVEDEKRVTELRQEVAELRGVPVEQVAPTPAPPTAEELRARELHRLREERAQKSLGFSYVLAERAARWPIHAAALLVLVTLPRCFADADPLMGANGNVICPYLCRTCEGPFRVHTVWHHDDDGSSTNGPSYYCQSQGGEREPFVSPAATTYLAMLLVSAPLVIVSAIVVFRRRRRRVEAIDRRLQELEPYGGPPPPPSPPTGFRLRALRWVAFACLVPTLVTVIELAIFRASW
ncbi:MAG: hypothetical protein KC731_35920, partial [Myxococcales bacterium]|nr:hypothetical protein [Myxococcales bacterium]